MQKILDLHIHSRYSRACSKDLTLPNIAKTCEIRGIDIVATGDFTHPAWFSHMKECLEEENEGVYKLKDGSSKTRFIIGTEVASIRKHKDAVRRIHLLIFAPSIAAVERFNNALEDRGCNIHSDGRPIIGLTSKEILALALECDPRMMVVPAHAWTPWFGVFGSKGGYNSLEDAFEDLTPHVRAIETGLSSDPLMNWRVSQLDNITLISNSDAHSVQKLGREANVMEFTHESDITYSEITRIIREGNHVKSDEASDHVAGKFLYTIEFYPEEGKYHYDGHRDCGFRCTPEETKKYGGLCPKCKKPLTIGVMNRVAELADRSEEEILRLAQGKRIPYRSLVPLPEIIADTLECGVSAKAVAEIYDTLIKKVGSEFFVLLHASLDDIARATSQKIAEAIDRVRKGNIVIEPGYDGVFGVVKVFKEGEHRGGARQMGLQLA